MLAKAISSGLLINANKLHTDNRGNLHGVIVFCVNQTTLSLLDKELKAFFGKDIFRYTTLKKEVDTRIVILEIPKPVSTVSETMTLRQFFVTKKQLDDFVKNCRFTVVYG